MELLKAGLVSITFRQMKPVDIVRLVQAAGLEGIEWGGDIHVPHGDVATAKAVSAMMADAGLQTAAYGSYYNVGCADPGFDQAKRVFETAAGLGAPTVRMWAGEKGSADADDLYRRHVADRSRAIAELAGQWGGTVSFEFHHGTLTDTNDSANRLLDDVGDSRVKSYWQPDYTMDAEYRLKGLVWMKPRLTNLHVFHWQFEADGSVVRNPLIAGRQELKAFFECVRALPGTHYAMIEFVKGDSPEQFKEDAAALKELLPVSRIPGE
jgi:3-dehydroshikimate dehydratase